MAFSLDGKRVVTTRSDSPSGPCYSIIRHDEEQPLFR
jgi:hypothetical protein